MADALCGPSNPLQTFQKQTSTDRTLQQDRTASRRRFEQGFRSSPGPNAGVLEAEFEAFQAGQTLQNGFPQSQQFAPGPAFANHDHQSSKGGAPSWAVDFQSLRLNESRAQPLPQHQFRQQAPIQHSAPGGWHQHAQTAPVESTQQRITGGKTLGDVYTNNHRGFFHSGMAMTKVEQKQPERQMEGSYDQSEMERMFEVVTLEQNETQNPSPLIDLAQDLVDMHPNEEVRIGSDTIADEPSREEQEHTSKDDADELARTAGQLLDNMKHDQSQKFQNSSFLSLMRQLRDREVHVEGDRIIDARQGYATPQPLHPGGHFYPVDTPVEGRQPLEDASNEGLSGIKLA